MKTAFYAAAARQIGNEIGINWKDVGFDKFCSELAVELEHGPADPDTDVMHSDPILTGKIAFAHLRALPTTTRDCAGWKSRPRGVRRRHHYA
ncbi:MAG: DUF5661 family protein [Tepidiformaceae bacterium]